MSALGTGTANGGISVLHAAGLGKGCSVGIELQCEVKLVKGEIFPIDERAVVFNPDACLNKAVGSICD